MAKGKSANKMTKEQRRLRSTQVVFIVISVIVILSWILTLTTNY
jgi:hypothetical protein